MAAPEDRDLLIIGRILRSHGVLGEVKVLPESDEPERLLGLAHMFTGVGEKSVVLRKVESARIQQTKKGVILLIAFEDVKGKEMADLLRQQLVYATKEDLPPLGEGEYFLHELIGCRVDTDNGELIGTLKEIVELPAHNMYVIKRPGQKDVMIPAVPAFIENIDVDAQIIVIRPIEGLLDV